MSLTIRAKLVGLALLVSLMMAGPLAVFTLVGERRSQIEAVEHKGVAAVTLLAETLVDPLYELRIDQIDRLLGAARWDTELAGVYALDRDGRVLSDGGKDSPLLDQSLPGLDPILAQIRRSPGSVPQREDGFIAVTGPVRSPDGEILGFVHLRLSLRYAEEQIAEQWRTLAALGGAVFLLGGFLALVLARQITRPLREMAKATEDICIGNFDIHVAVERQDELGALAQAINKMAENLQQTTVSRDELASEVVEREQAEDEIRLLNETLEQRVQEEVAINREKDHMLIRQSRLAAIGEMIGNIAHQWRQPLNALGLLLDNIQDAHVHDELDSVCLGESVAKGQRLIDKMSSTIDDFRNFFKPDREKTQFSLEKAVRDALSVVEASLKSGHIAVDLKIERDDVTVSGFPNEYAQVVANILGNAKDAIQQRQVRDGKVEITIGADDVYAYVAIRDNGGGIPEDVLEKIFDPYFTTREKGTGIGLYMSKMIIETNMNGRIDARNTGEGAEFRIVVPLAGEG